MVADEKSEVNRLFYNKLKRINKNIDINKFTNKIKEVMNDIQFIYNNQFDISYYDKDNTRHFVIAFLTENNILETVWLYKGIK
ncbi:TPA: hypothetical protein PTV74_003123 [Clostridium botulinum]|nr:hypothetical protein [Clostridium botulinum]HDK7206278.1 hypothetical protein [Clostridium botulinum]HDK7210014.1 hypothetical protein [Clostridium botulinum]HDK7265463.1 hypothetical protein [Clostridium botulinum]HDK7269311.1 hypothetical protein [Clostridium botulinum]